ncbi:MAG: serine/threonine protein kinase [Kofleriaceae bacterium]|nr:serine/threonine protein kinase [Kofleriaceae bacterium]
MSSSRCLTASDLEALARRELSGADADRVDEHLAACATCRAVAVAAARPGAAATTPRSVGEDPSDEHVATAPTVRSDRGADVEPPRPAPPRRGDVLALGATIGRYQLRRLLGQGGMGVVYAAHDPELDREVALKVIRAGASDTADVRLLREGQAIARLVHPNVVAVHDVGRAAEGRLFIAMELVDGQPLSEWIAQARAWREVVRVLGAAARGLIAAHQAGLVHRDFKPANVFLGADGRVKVGDFGLARADGPAPATEAGAGVELPSPDLTQSGALVGTPAYMAPEQLAGQPASAASDQFALAVTLYEALYGERPFAGGSLAALIDTVSSEQVRPPRPGRDVPRWLRAAVVRGLRTDPRQRHPSVAALLAAIERDPAARRRRVVAASTALGLAALAGGVVVRGAVTTGDRCARVGAELDAAWTPRRREEVRAAFIAVAQPYAAAALDRALTGLDARVDAWRAMRRSSCQATATGAQTEAQLGVREVCLTQRRIELEAVIARLAQADAAVVARVDEVLPRPGALAPCADLAALSVAVPPPADAATRAEVVRLERVLAEAGVRGRLGDYAAGQAAADAAVRAAEPLGYPPIHARALLLAGGLAMRLGQPAEAERLLTSASLAAEAGRDDRTRTSALIGLVRAVGLEQRRHADGLAWARHADAVVARLGADPALAADLDADRALVLAASGDHAGARTALERVYAVRKRAAAVEPEALAAAATNLGNHLARDNELTRALSLLEEALALRQQLYGPRHPEVAAADFNLGVLAMNAGDPVAAEAAFRRALEVRQEVLPADHPDLAKSLGNLGTILRDQRKYDEALALFARAEAIATRNFPADSPRLIIPLYNLGATHLLARDLPAARAALERALAIAGAAGQAESAEAAAVTASLAQVATGQGKLDEARTLLERALAIDRALWGPAHPNVAADLDVLGDFHDGQGQHALAEAAYRQALAIKEQALGKDHVDLAITLSNLGSQVFERGRLDEALGHYRRALALDEAALGPDHADLIWDLDGVGRTLAALGRPAEAVPLLERALALPEAAAVGEPYHLAELHLAEALRALGRPDRARDLARRAVAGLRASAASAATIARAERLLRATGAR